MTEKKKEITQEHRERVKRNTEKYRFTSETAKEQRKKRRDKVKRSTKTK